MIRKTTTFFGTLIMWVVVSGSVPPPALELPPKPTVPPATLVPALVLPAGTGRSVRVATKPPTGALTQASRTWLLSEPRSAEGFVRLSARESLPVILPDAE